MTRSPNARYLTKSRFKLAVECPTKLFYTGKSEYRNTSNEDEFLAMLADGGFQVGELAKLMYPSGIEIKCQQQRSRELNRFLARRELCERLEEIRDGKKSTRQQAMEKIRRQKRRRSRRAKNRMLDDKSKHSNKKNLRKPPGRND